MAKKFGTTQCKGFQITFPNNKMVSVQFGYGNYCENYDREDIPPMTRKYMQRVESENAEVAVIDTDTGNFITGKCVDIPEYEEVYGYAGPEEVLEIMKCASKLED